MNLKNKNGKSFHSKYIDKLKEKHAAQKGDLNRDVLIKLILALKKQDIIDNEDLAYRPELFEFTRTEYDDFHEYLDKKYNKKYAEDHTKIFPELRMNFEYGDFRFIWRLICGQGTCTQLLSAKPKKPYPKEWKMKFNEKKMVKLT